MVKVTTTLSNVRESGKQTGTTSKMLTDEVTKTMMNVFIVNVEQDNWGG